jgi:hypothetical protein
MSGIFLSLATSFTEQSGHFLTSFLYSNLHFGQKGILPPLDLPARHSPQLAAGKLQQKSADLSFLDRPFHQPNMT